MFKLMEHLQNMGENSATNIRSNSIGQDTLLSAASIYQNLFNDGKNAVYATFQVKAFYFFNFSIFQYLHIYNINLIGYLYRRS